MYKTEEEEEEEEEEKTRQQLFTAFHHVYVVYICVLLFHLLLPLADFHFKFLTKQVTSILAFFANIFTFANLK